MRFPQQSDSRGSLRNIQLLINHHPKLINEEIRKQVQDCITIEWVSPLSADDHAEYRDAEFMQVLGLGKKGAEMPFPLHEFWPKLGPQWDALGRTKPRQGIFLVEAKAHLAELVSSPCRACGMSKELIMDSFATVKDYLSVGDEADWAGRFYQYTNRLAHLYYLRVLNHIDARLIFVYFTNDRSVAEPTTREQWEGAIRVMEECLGIPRQHPLRAYISDIFIDVAALQQ